MGARRSSSEILQGLEADRILRIVDLVDVDVDAALFVLEDTVEQLLETLGPILVADDRAAPMLFVRDLAKIRAALHLTASALLVHQMAREVSP